MSKLKAVDFESGEIKGDIVPEPARKCENADFVMLYRRFIFAVSELGMDDPQALKVFLFLVRHMGQTNAVVCSMDLMAKMLRISRQTISAKIRKLVEGNWLCVMKSGKSNVYIINPEIVWTSYADQKKYCDFKATVMLDYDDNWDISIPSDKKTLRHIDIGVLKSLAESEFPDPAE